MPSSTTTPVWGPQLPRLNRRRERKWFSYYPTTIGQARNGVTKVEHNWYPQGYRDFENVSRCYDTVRNPNFEPFRQTNFYDDGGPLQIRKGWWTHEAEGTGTITPWTGNNRVKYGLQTILTGGNHDGINPQDTYPPSIDLNVDDLHARAFAAAKPTNPLLDLGVILAEARDMTSLIKGRIESMRDISDWFLAIQFGWKPLLNDLMDTIKTIEKLDQQFQFLIRNNGKPVRRRVTLLDDATTLIIRDVNTLGSSRNTYVDWPGRSQRSSAWRHRISLATTTKAWASGEFVFYLGDTSLPTTEAYLKAGLLGLRVTPAVVWNAMPWSWLVDWFTNVGDVLDVLSEQVADRTVARYLYVMKETRREYQFYGTDGYFSTKTTHYYETKVREACHPFGLSFGGALTPLQYAILAAIGSQRF